MWIPIVLVIWSGVPEWHILPPPVKLTYPDRASCYQAIETAKDIIMSHPKYKKGMHLCVEMNYPEKPNHAVLKRTN